MTETERDILRGAESEYLSLLERVQKLSFLSEHCHNPRIAATIHGKLVIANAALAAASTEIKRRWEKTNAVV